MCFLTQMSFQQFKVKTSTVMGGPRASSTPVLAVVGTVPPPPSWGAASTPPDRQVGTGRVAGRWWHATGTALAEGVHPSVPAELDPAVLSLPSGRWYGAPVLSQVASTPASRADLLPSSRRSEASPACSSEPAATNVSEKTCWPWCVTIPTDTLQKR